MNYRYRMHWYSNPEAPLNAGRALFGQTPEDAIAHAANLWKEGRYAAALEYCVLDTDDGTVIWRGRRDETAVAQRGMQRLSACKP